MIQLTIEHSIFEGESLTTYTLEGDTYEKKDMIKKLGFRWKFPLPLQKALVDAHGAETALYMQSDKMFSVNKRWTKTVSASLDESQERRDWIAEVKKTLEISEITEITETKKGE